MIDLRRMRHAVTVMRTGSYVAAAQALGMTQPALSRSIQSIEADYDLRLFDRGRAGVFATDAGAEFVARAEQLLAEAQTLDEAMRAQRDGVGGAVRFGMGPLIASICLPGALPRLLTAFPAVDHHAVVGASADLTDRIVANTLQFAICSGEALPRGDFMRETLGRLDLGLIARAGHPLAGRRVRPADLAAYPLIGGSVDERVTLVEDSYAPRLVCDNYEILRSVALSSDALWLTAPATVTRELDEGSMTALDIAGLFSESYEVVLIGRQRGSLSRAATLIRDTLVQALAPFLRDG